jgi:hypothetical protein
MLTLHHNHYSHRHYYLYFESIINILKLYHTVIATYHYEHQLYRSIIKVIIITIIIIIEFLFIHIIHINKFKIKII